jgi:hypothetical protein
MADKQTARVLREVFDRLYMLRCQIIHGGSTWGGKVNRDQVKDGAAILGTFIPIMVDIMMDNCQSAPNTDPRSASNFDPSGAREIGA